MAAPLNDPVGHSRRLKSRHPALKAVLCDLDGTLLDTMPLWFAAQRSLADRWRASWTSQDAQATAGQTMGAVAQLLQARGVLTDVGSINRTLNSSVVHSLATGGLPWMSGAEQLLDKLHQAPGVTCALVTSTESSVVRSIPRLMEVFDVVITGDQVTNGKPHPEPYRQAIRALKVEPSQCLAIEDSTSGATSAEQAGAVVLVVGQLQPVRRQIHAGSLLGLTINRLEEIHSEHAYLPSTGSRSSRA